MVTTNTQRTIPYFEEAPTDMFPNRVFVYRNLSRQRQGGAPIYSVQDTRTGRVLAHVEQIALHEVALVVRPAGREKVRKEKVKNVHAGLRGSPVILNENLTVRSATYNPYTVDTFVDKETSVPVLTAPYAHVNGAGLAYKPESSDEAKKF